jgi:hypothetical protein
MSVRTDLARRILNSVIQQARLEPLTRHHILNREQQDKRQTDHSAEGAKPSIDVHIKITLRFETPPTLNRSATRKRSSALLSVRALAAMVFQTAQSTYGEQWHDRLQVTVLE